MLINNIFHPKKRPGHGADSGRITVVSEGQDASHSTVELALPSWKGAALIISPNTDDFRATYRSRNEGDHVVCMIDMISAYDTDSIPDDIVYFSRLTQDSMVSPSILDNKLMTLYIITSSRGKGSLSVRNFVHGVFHYQKYKKKNKESFPPLMYIDNVGL